MAVAVKTSPGARPSSLLANPATLSLIGLVYLLGCLGIVFKLLPDLWWTGWEAVGLGRFVFVGGAALSLVGLAVGVGLLMLGARLLGPNPPVGVRSGVFVAFTGLLLVLLLTRWASLWIEHWAFEYRTYSETVGMAITAGVGLALLIAWLRFFTRDWMQGYVVRLEQAGWFHATAYKHNQGQKVRRATIFGILLLVGAGIWTMITHRTLGRDTTDWALNIPFTGKVAIEKPGDTEPFILELPKGLTDQVQVRFAGNSALPVKGRVSFEQYKEAVRTSLDTEESRLKKLREKLKADTTKTKDQLAAGISDKEDKKKAEATLRELETKDRSAERRQPQIEEARKAIEAISDKAPVIYIKTLNQRLYKEMQELQTRKVFKEDAIRRLRDTDTSTSINDLTTLIGAYRREAENAKRSDELGVEFILPRAVVLVDRYALRDKVNDRTDPKANAIITNPGDSKLKEGEIYSREKIREEEERLKKEKKSGGGIRDMPEERALLPASGPTTFAALTLLPSVQFTVPLLLIAVSLWLAWRMVNMPTFADFLIATEAEMNKVSWTTQKRLIQDTIVVLITTALLALFLLVMDLTWKTVLSWKPIGVLHTPPTASDESKGVDHKKW